MGHTLFMIVLLHVKPGVLSYIPNGDDYVPSSKPPARASSCGAWLQLQREMLNVDAVSRTFIITENEESDEFGIKTFEFNEDDIMRSELVKFLVKKFKELK